MYGINYCVEIMQFLVPLFILLYKPTSIKPKMLYSQENKLNPKELTNV